MIKDLPTDTHERLVDFQDEKAGLRGFIAIHNTNLGPATGGTRFKAYEKDEDAIHDALRLSKAMTYKCAMANVPYGGGKSVIMSNSARFNLAGNKAFFETYARIVNLLKGEFTTGKDVGISDEHIAHMSRVSPHISSRIGDEDPSIYAGLGTFIAMMSAVETVYGSADLSGKRVSIKGLGQVGFELARLVSKAGGVLTVADIDENKLLSAKSEFGDITIASPMEIHKVKADIYAPCALGGEFNEVATAELDCDIVCGAANNQLASSDIGAKLMNRGVVYVPDYVANAGGLIAVVDGFQHKKFDSERIKNNLLVIKDNVSKVLGLSRKQNRPTEVLADELAESIIYGSR